MQMIRKNDRRRNLERMPHLRIAEGGSQQVNMFGEQMQPAISKVYGEKIAGAGDKIAPVARHALPFRPC
jgi:hypothetical protein